jgi:UDP-N-acetyl-D-mannosaminuronic acid dehydrogenase
MQNKQSVCVLGLGYIGLPSAALLASKGYQVHGVDISESVVKTINEGHIHIVEPDLDTFVQAAVQSNRLKASLSPKESDIFIIAVPTPFHEGYVPNVDYVVDAAKSIAPFVKSGNIVILESTSPVGTTHKVADTLREAGVDTEQLHIAHCPERVLPGKIMIELTENDRIIGGLTREATQKTAAFYRTFVTGDILETDAKTAEMAKLTENASRDVNIAFANELSILCDKEGIDVWELISLANRHPRVNILQPGCGVGGHCIAVDPWFLVHQGGKDASLIKEARLKNDYKSDWVIEKVKNAALKFEMEKGRKPTVACMGLAFKPDIDDLRESPALKIAQKLNESLNIVAVEPNIQEHSSLSLVGLDTLKADIIVYLVAHKEFKTYSSQAIELDFCGISE